MTNLNYTNREIVTIKNTLVNQITTLTDKWTDFNESDIGMTFIEFIASVGDFLNFYMDHQALETYLDTAVQDKNIRALLRTMNYRIALKGGAKGVIKITMTSPVERNIFIPRYTQFRCVGSDIPYCTTRDYYMYTGGISLEMDVVQGEFKRFTTSKRDILASGMGRRVYLNSLNVAEDSVEILQDNVIWEEVEDVILEYKGDIIIHCTGIIMVLYISYCPVILRSYYPVIRMKLLR